MVSLSGHGINDASLDYVYLPVNADPAKLKRTGVTMSDFRSALANLTGKAVFFLDTCHAGNVAGAGWGSGLSLGDDSMRLQSESLHCGSNG